MYANVAINVPLKTLFTYKVPSHLKSQIKTGVRVVVPFRKKQVIGVCFDVGMKNSLPDKEIKELVAIASGPGAPDGAGFLDQIYLNWLSFAAEYYNAAIGQVVAQAMPPSYLSLKSLNGAGKRREAKILFDDNFPAKSVDLTAEQRAIVQAITGYSDSFHPVLLHGVTGSGKTEIYIALIKASLKRNKSCLFLVPEIGLTPQMLSRLGHHFSGRLLVYHSGLSPNQRLNQWRRCLDDEASVMVGTRSAVFAPFRRLGLIIVDEEHDASYKQEDRFRYHARDLAVRRAQMLEIPVIMGSATPSLESFYQAQTKKYHYHDLRERIGGLKLPKVEVADFTLEREQTGWPLLVSKKIHDAIKHFSQAGRQVMVFVGQRGSAQSAYCVACKTIQLCRNCSVGLKFHRRQNILKCHYCDDRTAFNEVCVACGKKALTLLGFGTQSVEDEIRSMHPKLVVARLDSDAAGTAKQVQKILADFARQKIHVLIGTQMITKGHDFANVGLVCVLGMDAHLGLPDFRAQERAFQTLVQVAGRAGRESEQGLVLVQSLVPAHPAIQLAVTQDYAKFARAELKQREDLLYPPFARLVQIRFQSHHKKSLDDFLKSWNGFLARLNAQVNADDVRILGPAEMPISKLRRKYRSHILLKIKRGFGFKEFLHYIVADLEKRKPRGIQYHVDVDPVSLL